MFEFEKQIMKAEGKFPMVTYPYKVKPITDEAKFSFAKFKNIPHHFLSDSERKRFIKENLNVERSPFIGEVNIYEDVNGEKLRFEIEHYVIRTLAMNDVPGVDYKDPFGTFRRVNFSNLEYRKDFIIEIGEKIIQQQKQEKLTFADIKAL
ncbi:hypothetical protein [Niallia taxi]|uniref:Uncharacterized protein n=1 Tax=Niallia taxi TaxID=2499688 RepID=A0A3S2WYL3_9BACI|nr:hypothetical protein [Niallia taxi]RVT56428.1 hypothetical protein EM808_27455 [Niallia taxi]